MAESSAQERTSSSSSPRLLTLSNGLKSQHAGEYWFPPHIRACPTISGAVILDLKRNRYFGVGKNETRALFTLEREWSQANSHAGEFVEPMPPEAATRIADDLVNAGLLSREAPEESLPTGTIDLNGTLTSVGHEVTRSVGVGFTHIMRFLRACAWARQSLRSRTLYSVACEISGAKLQATRSFEVGSAVELVCIFRRLRPFAFAAKDQCLFHALALVKFLSYYQVFPTWVIGIRARPWSAHSWVQEGSLLLDSNPEHVCEYTPILTI